ncbi:hypothetical protein OX284_014285 [Flavobacterium sp. SUN046]|uniref:hypothetical protein n=1 Tax=Flavobacterium sp. SUN046 TaxID=3002440 RepID=UPI002DBA7016|nr:hypothetical protein [Flavobacterium sp. SUN046]MEC4050604.1 hypothetical protein [Flavobacterium sp. SUN046]
MKYIIQRNTTPIVVVIDNDGLLENHPSISQHPELFEIVELKKLPIDTQYLNYETN